MKIEHAKEILHLIEPDNTLQEIVGGNKIISTAERLCLAIRFLARDESFGSLSRQLHISNQRGIRSVCKDIVKYLVLLYLKVP